MDNLEQQVIAFTVCMHVAVEWCQYIPAVCRGYLYVRSPPAIRTSPLLTNPGISNGASTLSTRLLYKPKMFLSGNWGPCTIFWMSALMNRAHVSSFPYSGSKPFRSNQIRYMLLGTESRPRFGCISLSRFEELIVLPRIWVWRPVDYSVKTDKRNGNPTLSARLLTI